MSGGNTSTLKTERIAENRAKKYKSLDPFPDIPPALLNSADIHDYIDTTGLLFPYNPERLKSSSYEVEIGDKAYYWDGKGDHHEIELSEDSGVTLKPNELVFFKTKQRFRLPHYIAVRFNLRITNVHRGLLLGTGPLVDPGFDGHLLIPLHNLTNNTYKFFGGEKFIWVEFTKTSPLPNQASPPKKVPQKGVHKPFPDDKINQPSRFYFKQANDHEPIRNAIPAEVQRVRQIAKRAETAAERSESYAQKITRRITVGGSIAIAALIAAFISLVYDSISLSNQVRSTISDFEEKYSQHLLPHELVSEELSSVHIRLEELQALYANLNSEKEERKTLELQIAALQAQIADLAQQVAEHSKPIALDQKTEPPQETKQ